MAPSLRYSLMILLFSCMTCGCSLHAMQQPVASVVRAQNEEAPIRTLAASAPPGLTMQDAGSPTEPTVYLPITLREAIEAALADSSVVRTLNGRVNIAAITPTDVMMAERQICVEEGRFQPRLSANYDGTQVNQPPNAYFGPGISFATRRDSVSAMARISQPLTTGGSISIGIEPPTAYLYFPNGVEPGQFNPVYATDYVVRVKQPVLQGGGRSVTLAPIRIAQVQANQSRWALEEVLNSQIRSITEGYWRLYAAHLQVQAVHAVLPLAEESVRIEGLRLKADRSILADVARAQVQLDSFRRTESSVLGLVRKRSLQLRQLMGGEPQVQPLLLTSEKPNELPLAGETTTFIDTALQNRPTLNLMRERLQEKRIVWGVAQNRVLPSLELRGEYWMNGIGQQLDDSFKQATTGGYADWTVGFGLEVPIGNTTARSRAQIAELDTTRTQLVLTAMEKQVSFEIAENISELQASWQQLEIAKRQARETQEWLRVSRIRYTQPPAAGNNQDWLLLALTDLQSAMTAYFNAISNVGDALADYNTLLATLQQAQGISVYEWRNSANVPDFANEPGLLSLMPGHAGMAYQNYRVNPEFTMPSLETSPNATPPATAEAGEQHIPSFGHSFLNSPDVQIPPSVGLP